MQPATPSPTGMSTTKKIVMALLILAAILIAAMIGMGLFVAKKAVDFVENPVGTAAALLKAANADLEVLETNEKSGTIRVRDKKKNETYEINFEDLKKGKVTVIQQAPGGEEKVAFEMGKDTKAPAWVPAYPGAKVAGGFRGANADKERGFASMISTDPPAKVAAHYEAELKKAGYTITRKTEEAVEFVTAEDPKSGRKAEFKIASIGDKTTIAVEYTDAR
jgi:hypothetical protein